MDVRVGHKESWAPENWCFWSVVWRRLLRVPWTARRSRPVHPKGNQSWIFIGRTDVEAETPILWLPDAKNWLIGKDPWCWERVRAEGEGDDRGQDGWMASLTRWTWVWVNSRSWWWTGRPGVLQSMGWQRDTTEQLNWTELIQYIKGKNRQNYPILLEVKIKFTFKVCKQLKGNVGRILRLG